jgi:hypothetical protein
MSERDRAERLALRPNRVLERIRTGKKPAIRLFAPILIAY